MAARLRDRYQKDVAPQIAKEFGITNPMAVPRLEKVVINMGMGEAIANQKILDTAADELRAITGQKPVITKAKKSIASFKLRQGMPIGVVVTLRGDRQPENTRHGGGRAALDHGSETGRYEGEEIDRVV